MRWSPQHVGALLAPVHLAPRRLPGGSAMWCHRPGPSWGRRRAVAAWYEALALRREPRQARRGKMANRSISTGGTASGPGSTLVTADGGRPLDTQSAGARAAGRQLTSTSSEGGSRRLRLAPSWARGCRGRSSAGTRRVRLFMRRQRAEDGGATSGPVCLIRVGWARSSTTRVNDVQS